MKTNDEIIKTLNNLRNREGISISELARRVDMAKSSVSRYFNGTREFPLNYVDKFASALHTTPESLIGVSPVDPFKLKKLNVHSYPYIPADISAGILCNVDPLTSDDVETIQLPDSVMGRYAGDSSILMMHINGESMNQTIPDGSLIAVKQYNDIQDLKDGDIVVFADDGTIAVSGRELHDFLEVDTPYTQWFDRMIDYGFTENTDFKGLSQKSEKPIGGRPRIDHVMTLDMAKEVAMIQRTDRGKQRVTR